MFQSLIGTSSFLNGTHFGGGSQFIFVGMWKISGDIFSILYYLPAIWYYGYRTGYFKGIKENERKI